MMKSKIEGLLYSEKTISLLQESLRFKEEMLLPELSSDLYSFRKKLLSYLNGLPFEDMFTILLLSRGSRHMRNLLRCFSNNEEQIGKETEFFFNRLKEFGNKYDKDVWKIIDKLAVYASYAAQEIFQGT